MCATTNYSSYCRKLWSTKLVDGIAESAAGKPDIPNFSSNPVPANTFTPVGVIIL